MSDTTPGQRAYAAYWPYLGLPPRPPWQVWWDQLTPRERAGWEAAAEAVLEARASLCPICHAALERVSAKEPPHA